MTPPSNSIRAYHRERLKTDLPIAIGASCSVLTTTLLLALLHDRSSMTLFIIAAALALCAIILCITVATREVFRRLHGPTQRPATVKPGVMFAVVFVAGLLATGGVCSTPLRTGIAWQSGKRHLDSQNYQAAIDSFTQYVELQPEKPMGYYWRGLAAYHAGMHDAAYSDLNVAIRLAPRDRNAHILYLGTLDRLGRDSELEAGLRDAEQWAPGIRDSLAELRSGQPG